MTRACDKGNTRAFEVVIRIGEGLDFQFAAIAGAGIDMADAQRTPEYTMKALVNTLDANAVLVRLGRRLAEHPGTSNALEDIEHGGFTRRGRCRKG